MIKKINDPISVNFTNFRGQENLEEEIAEKNRKLIVNTTAETSRNQKHNELLDLLKKIEVPVNSNGNLLNAISKLKQHSKDGSFEDSFLLHFEAYIKAFF